MKTKDDRVLPGKTVLGVSQPPRTKEPSPTRWWQWWLVYPAFGISLLGAVPTFVEAYKSTVYSVDYGYAETAKEQDEMWRKNLTCTTAPFEYFTTASQVGVDATICKSGDVFIRVKSPPDVNFYKWISIDSVLKKVPSKSSKSNFSFAEKSLSLLIGAANASPSGESYELAQTQVICQRFIGQNQLLRRYATPRGCYDEIVNTYSGYVINSYPAPCGPC